MSNFMTDDNSNASVIQISILLGFSLNIIGKEDNKNIGEKKHTLVNLHGRMVVAKYLL